MSVEVDYIDKALASLDDVSARELEAVAEKFVRPRDGLREFGFVFSAVCDERSGHAIVDPRFRLEQAIAGMDERLAARMAEAESPFWHYVIEAWEQREEA